MPYILRDHDGKISRVSVNHVPGADMVAPNDPELEIFLIRNGQDPKKIDNILAELRKTDGDMARAVEDVIMALLKKNILRMTDLPKQVQDRMAHRVSLRMSIQEAYEQASDHNTTKTSFVTPSDVVDPYK